MANIGDKVDTVQYIAVQFSAHYSTTVQCSAVQYLKCSRVQYSILQYSAVETSRAGAAAVTAAARFRLPAAVMCGLHCSLYTTEYTVMWVVCSAILPLCSVMFAV